MEVKQSGQDFLAYIQKDEPVMKNLTSICKKNDIFNGQISGIGAVNCIEIGAYDLSSKNIYEKYIKKYMNWFHFREMSL